MKNISDSQHLVPQCHAVGCERMMRGANICDALLDPERVWADGECWAITHDKFWRVPVAAATADYALRVEGKREVV